MKKIRTFWILTLIAFAANAAVAQSTAITYQGQLMNLGMPADGNFDFEFVLYNALAGGSQVGPVVQRPNTPVANGSFTTTLDFGNQFPGADRYLEIRVRQVGEVAFTTLAPRQAISSSPYSIKAISSDTANTANTAASAGSANTAVTATSAANFTGGLSGDVTGGQQSTVVTRLQGRNVASSVPTNGQVLKYNSTSQRWEPANDETATSTGGTITGISPGTGLTGGGTSGSVTLGIAPGGVGTTQIADGSVTDAKITGVSGNKVTGAVANATNAINAANATNATLAANATNATTAVNAQNAANLTTPLGGDVSGLQSSTTVGRIQGRSIAPTAPSNGQVLKYNSATNQWEPALDETATSSGGTITGITPGTGLTGGGTTGTVTLGIAPGGIGTTQLADSSVTDAKITAVDGAKVSGTVANATNAATASNATQLGGTAASQFVQTTDPRLTDARTPAPGSAAYVQNQSAGPQASTNFNISGNGIAVGTLSGGIVNAATQFNLQGSRILAVHERDMFIGVEAGPASTTGPGNTFVGYKSGLANTTGVSNVFLGAWTGTSNTSGVDNTFIGGSAGNRNTSGGANSFIGSGAGGNNTTGNLNTFVGTEAGFSNTTGTQNTIMGAWAGTNSTTGSSNSFFGTRAGIMNTIGVNNTMVGREAGFSNTSGGSNSFFGVVSGHANSTGGSNSFFGTGSGSKNTTGGFNSFFGNNAGQENTIGTNNVFVGYMAGFANSTGSSNTLVGTGADLGASNLTNATAIGANAVVSRSNAVVLGNNANVGIGISSPSLADKLHVSGTVRVDELGVAGPTTLCRNAFNQISNCSSSMRYKTDPRAFSSGLKLVNDLRPISFKWRDGGMSDLGLAAEDVATIEPLLVTYNKDGQVEGVKYDRIGVVLINAIKEQQAQIEQLQKQVQQLISERTRRSGTAAKRRR